MSGKKTKDMSNLVSVYGSGVGMPLLSTNDARVVQIHDKSGELAAMVVRITDGLWGFVARGDPDWEDIKGRSYIDDSEI